MILTTIIFIILCAVCLGFLAWFSVKGASEVKDSHYYKDDHDLRNAHMKLTVAAIIASVAEVVLIVGGLALVFYTGGMIATFNFPLVLTLAIFLGLLLTTGLFNAYAAYRLRETQNYSKDSHAEKAYKDALWSVGLGFGGIIVFALYVIILLVVRHRQGSVSYEY